LKKGLRMLMLLSAALAVSAHAQVASPPAQPPTSVITAQDLAKSVHNPFEDSVKLSIQSATGFELGPHHNAGDSFNIQPLVPFSLNTQWDVIARPSLTVTYLPSPHEQFGVADLQTSFFLTPAKATTWIWGVGPIFRLPTASSPELGTGQWSAGPTAALIYSEGPVRRHRFLPTGSSDRFGGKPLSLGRVRRSAVASRSEELRFLLQSGPEASLIEQECAELSAPAEARPHRSHPNSGRATSLICKGLGSD